MSDTMDEIISEDDFVSFLIRIFNINVILLYIFVS